MSNPIKDLTRKEWMLWLGSLCIVILSNTLTENMDILTLVAACVGITSLIFAAKGNVWAQILMVVFSVLYGIISWRFHYWGEMITYLGMALPMAVWSTITWIKNPAPNGKEVAIQKLKPRHILGVIVFAAVATCLFYRILDALNTPHILFSTISIATSVLAATLTMLRSSYYALGYASNDVVLIILWTLASMENPVYIPVVVNFAIFFFNDMYGFLCWKRREKISC